MGNQSVVDADLVMMCDLELNTSHYSADSRNGDFIQTLVPDNPSNKLRIALIGLGL